MDKPTALVVFAHHRADSLTAVLARRTADRLEAAGYRVDLLDLHAEGFDPRNRVEDEPDYGDRDKRYSPEVHAHAERLLAADLVAAVFPVWWFGLPALLKGWIDRVWNYGLTYGRREKPMAGKRMLWLGLAGLAEDDPNSDLTRALLDGALRRGISEFCDVTDVHTEALFDSEAKGLEGADRERHYAALLARADVAVDKLLAG
ncbi:NAD(P)H oxidoreductase [Glycomyces algeriensis]|uniref:NADPH oxidoreductase n=1 Tax=Glycomyces algeriensis TaxID=256037 RepID=A0A9W6LEI3_9ACTN|nr:NAD(P)H oxidoreductase [Glycomyces algeriensis]MDA1368432.1 NAD(P)H oxidoreductase [Glycomyces algeriensis]MDR7353238.1 putative NADPH-quinone reductase [Glycomyces algeriensis]GLI40932.1 NADPH oxidoreductase [Glycomyces algeriensis]